MNWDAIVWILLLIFGVASIGGGIVLYRQTRQAGWRAVGMGFAAGGVASLLVVALTVPVSNSGEAPEPTIAGKMVSTQPTDAPKTSEQISPPTGDTPSVISGSSPRASLTYEGGVYYQNPQGTDEAAKFNEDDLQLVGSTSESNTLSPGGGDSLTIYRLKDGEASQVYTLDAGRTFRNEDGKTITIEAEWIRWIASNESAPVTSGFMVPRPNNVQELVDRAQVIVLGTIDSVLEEKMMGAYGEDGQPLPAVEGGLPFTDYKLQIENVLKGDGTVTDGGTLVLRMFGHLSDKNAAITPNLFTLPNTGDHLLFALGQNPDGTYGSGPEGLFNVDGEKVAYADGVAFATNVSPEQFVYDVTEWGALSPLCCKKP